MQNDQNNSNASSVSSSLTNQLRVRKQVAITIAKGKLGEIVDGVRYQGDTVLLVKSGKPAALIVPVDMYRKWQAERAKDYGAIRQLQSQVTEQLSPEQAMTLALETQNALRKELTNGE